ncbi:MAG: hypothetical protein HZLCBSQH_002204 [Candidatus Fervidibacterota bacterium]
MGSLVASLLIVVAVAAVGYFVWWVFARLYFVRATADRAFVRTGGGEAEGRHRRRCVRLTLVARHHLGVFSLHESPHRSGKP